MARFVRRFCASEDGAGLVEYSLLLGLLAIGAAGIVTVYRRAVEDTFNRSTARVAHQAAGGYGAIRVSAGTVASGGGSSSGDEDPEPEPDDSSSTIEASGRNTPFEIAAP